MDSLWSAHEKEMTRYFMMCQVEGRLQRSAKEMGVTVWDVARKLREDIEVCCSGETIELQLLLDQEDRGGAYWESVYHAASSIIVLFPKEGWKWAVRRWLGRIGGRVLTGNHKQFRDLF